MAETKKTGVPKPARTVRAARLTPPTRLTCTNMLPNGDFKVGEPFGKRMEWATQNAHGLRTNGGCAAGAPWEVWNNAAGIKTTTELLRSETVPGGTMLHVTISPLPGHRAYSANGIGAHWQANGAGPTGIAGDTRPGGACAWIMVVWGWVGLGVGDGGDTLIGAILRKTGSWEMLQVTSQPLLREDGTTYAPAANEVILYNASEAPAEFYVESVQVTWDRGPFHRCPCTPQ